MTGIFHRGVGAAVAAVCLASLPAGLAQADTSTSPDVQARVIVKFKSAASAQTAQIAAAQSTTAQVVTAQARVKSMAQRLGVSLQGGRVLNAQMQVMQGSGMSSEALAARLAQEADVEYAVPDKVRTIRAVTPNDPLFSSQWYLGASSTTTLAAINAQGAWDMTTGSASVVIADIDTGVRSDHVDLSAKLLPGYTFIGECLRDASQTNCNNVATLAPYAGADDPGDFVTASDMQQSFFNGCSVANSSWHGTRVSGILGAATNNSVGIAGVSWGSRLLPVRVLGKCGGRDSDIIAGMRWAAGLSVTGATTNPNPAQVINLSLGGKGTCSAAYQETIAELTAKGVVVVAAAGNENTSVGEPGNCPGVLTVAGVRHIGSKVGYSSYGSPVGIAAPAGNCVNTNGGTCVYPINTTTNPGTQSPVTGSSGSTYTDGTNYSVGTSFSSPLVAGTAALMLSVNPHLSPVALIARLKGAARAFPPQDTSLPTCSSRQDSTLGTCSLPLCSAGTDSNGMCSCTTNTCGAGLLDTAAAVTQAFSPMSVVTVGTATAGSSVSLDGSSSAAATGRSIASYKWTLVNGGGVVTSVSNADQKVASVLPSASGTVTVGLTVTDSSNATDYLEYTFFVSPAPITTNGGSTGSTGGTTTGGTTTSTTTTASSGGGGAFDFSSVLGMLGLAAAGYLSRRRA